MLHSRSEKVPAPNVMKALLKLKELDQFTKQTNMLGMSGCPDKKTTTQGLLKHGLSYPRQIIVV